MTMRKSCGKCREPLGRSLTEVLEHFRKFGLELKPIKCLPFREEVQFLGKMWTAASCLCYQRHSDCKRMAGPHMFQGWRKILGFANCHISFVKYFAAIVSSLYEPTGKEVFKWGDEQQHAFDSLCNILVEPPVLTLPNVRDASDASDVGIGGVLSQVQDGVERVISFGSFSLTPEQKRHWTTRKEFLSIVRLPGSSRMIWSVEFIP